MNNINNTASNIEANDFISSQADRKFVGVYDEFLDFAEVRERNTEWVEVNPMRSKFIPLYNEPITASLIAAKYNCDSAAVEECMYPEHSGLLMKCGSLGARPIGDSAIQTILNRMKVLGGFWERQHHDTAVLAKDCNSSFAMMSQPLKVKVSDEMVRAVLSGRYTPIALPTVCGIAKSFLDKEYPLATFASGYYNHWYAEALWNLEAYAKRFVTQTVTDT